MPSLQAIQSAISTLPSGPPLVVVLAGGTTGIGAYIASALATTFASHGAKLRVYIVGRNASRAASVIVECQARSPGSEWRFVKASDLALVGEVDRCCNEIRKMEERAPFAGGRPKVDLLYCTYGFPILAEKRITSEGLDAFISTMYYTRIRFINKLLPLLLASPLPAHAISVYAGTMEDGTQPPEFPIGLPPDSIYGITSVRKHSCFMKTFAFEKLAQEHAGKLRLTHIFPGLVDGPGFLHPDMPTWFRFLWSFLMKPMLGWWYMTSPKVCGQVMVYLATEKFPARGSGTNGHEVARGSDGEVGGGAYSIGKSGDSQEGIMYEKNRKDGTTDKVWAHTIEVLEMAAKRAGEQH